jgi:Sulfotransferase domain
MRLTKRQRIRKAIKRFQLSRRQPPTSTRLAFIFGAQRSGTSMTGQVFGRHPGIEEFPENDEEAFDYYRLRQPPQIRDLVKRSHADVVICKPICDSQHARRLLDLFPQSVALWIYRDWKDVVNSSLRNFANYHRAYLKVMLEEPLRANWSIENVPDEHWKWVQEVYGRGSDEATCRSLIWYLRNDLFFQQNLETDPRVMLVQYDEMVTRPKDSFERMFRFVGVGPSDYATSIVHSSSVRKSQAPPVDADIAALCDSTQSRLDTYYSAMCARMGAVDEG